MIDELLKAVGVDDIVKISEPIVQAVGTSRLVISNMQGVLELEQEQILVKATKNYNIRVTGTGLVCKMMNKNELSVAGRIMSITWESK